jgi:hypothetical protein
MHVGSSTSKSKSEAMFFPASLKQAKTEVLNGTSILPSDLILPNEKRVHFVHKFKYLGSIVTPLLNEDAKVEARIKKAKSLMGIARTFYDSKDVNKRTKYQIYVAGPLNTLLWGVQNLESVQKKPRQTLKLPPWSNPQNSNDQLATSQRETHKKKEVRSLLCNIPKINAFITKRIAIYIGKVTKMEKNSLPRKFLAAWIRGSQKNGAPQLTCNNNFTKTICRILLLDKALSNKSALLREWIPLAKDTNNWQAYIDNYFEQWWKADPLEDPNTSTYKAGDEDEAK